MADPIAEAIKKVDESLEPKDTGKPSKEEIQEIVNGTGYFTV